MTLAYVRFVLRVTRDLNTGKGDLYRGKRNLCRGKRDLHKGKRDLHNDKTDLYRGERDIPELFLIYRKQENKRTLCRGKRDQQTDKRDLHHGKTDQYRGERDIPELLLELVHLVLQEAALFSALLRCCLRRVETKAVLHGIMLLVLISKPHCLAHQVHPCLQLLNLIVLIQCLPPRRIRSGAFAREGRCYVTRALPELFLPHVLKVKSPRIFNV